MYMYMYTCVGEEREKERAGERDVCGTAYDGAAGASGSVWECVGVYDIYLRVCTYIHLSIYTYTHIIYV